MILISNDFCHKIKMYNFDPYSVLLAIAVNIPVLLMTASVLQRHRVIFSARLVKNRSSVVNYILVDNVA